VTDSAIIPPTIDVLLQGPINELETLNLDEVVATLDLTGREVGSYLIEPRISAPGALDAESVIPEQVEVTITEARESRAFSVPVDARREPAGTYAAVTPRVVTVTLEGPVLELDDLDPARLRATVNLTGLTGGPHVLTPTLNAGDEINLVQVTPSQVSVRLYDEEDLLVTTVPIEVINLAPTLAATLSSEVAIVRVAGAGTVQGLTENPEFTVYVDAADLNEGSHTLRTEARLPEGYLLVNLIPVQIEVRLVEEQ
jgi:YbbR domain-containing protein